VIDWVLADGTMRERVEQHADRLRRSDPAATTAELLEGML
jgi:hypothetical protein